MGFFSDIGDILFGKEEEPSIQQVQNLSPRQSQLLQALGQQQQGLLNAPGQRFPGDIVPQAGPLSQQLQGLTSGTLGQAGQAFGRGLTPLTAQGLQQGSQPFLDALTGQFQQQVVPQIANQFGALDSARSSGLADRLGRAGAQLPIQAQQQFLGNRQFETQAGLQGLGFGAGIAGQQDRLNQLFQQGQLQNFQLGLPGADPRTRNLGQALGTPAFANIGLPGTQTPGIAGPLAGGFLGTEAGAAGFLGLLGGI